MSEGLDQFKKEWLVVYKKGLRASLVKACNSQVMDPHLIIMGQSLECSVKDLVVECLREVADDVEKSVILIR